MSRRRATIGYAVAWLVAAAVAVTVGVVAVSSAGSSMRDRGPLGIDTQIVRDQQAGATEVSPDPDAQRRRESFEGEYGSFVAECAGSVALGLDARAAPGWRTISYEEGPDDDVDAVFASGERSIELEVYCNAGVPTIGDREVNTLPDD